MKTYTLTVTQEQLDALAGFVNTGVQAVGLGAVRQAALVLDALESAKEIVKSPVRRRRAPPN